MNRRRFGILAGSSVTAAATGVARAQSAAPDASLLKTTLTPMGAERAGNADGSIPAWTGGVVAPPLGPNDPQDVPMFQNEQPLYTVDAANMAQYSHLLTDGVKLLMTKHGFRIKVYQTHRTAAMPQYVYDNIEKNLSRVTFEPAGGRFGLRGAYGGIPFPIINTAEPEIGGVQLIWNHLLAWTNGPAELCRFSAGYVVINGTRLMTFAGLLRYIVPYYDPKGTAETYQGYYYKLHEWGKAPASSVGQEALQWHSSNVMEKPDITWTLVNGQGRVRKAPDEAYDTPNPNANGIGNYDDSDCFTGSPQRYDWKLLGKTEMLVPYNCNAMALSDGSDVALPGAPNPDIVRWEKHRMWVVEATLHPGDRNTTARRMCYFDEDTYVMLMSDMYDGNNKMVKTAMTYNRCLPHLPGTIIDGYALWETDSGDYTVIGYMKYPGKDTNEYFGPENPEYFSPEQMAASASF